MTALSEHPQAGFCFSQLAVFVDGTKEVRHYTGDRSSGPAFDLAALPSHISPQDFYEILAQHYIWISGNTVVARRDLLRGQGGFPPALRWHADWLAFYLLALRHGACVVPETLAMMRERPQTYSGLGMRDEPQQRRVMSEILAYIKRHQNADVLHFFRHRPSLLSLFGWPMVRTAARSGHFDVAVPLMLWWIRRHAKYGRRLAPLRHFLKEG